MSRAANLAAGAGIGVVLMYLLDPQQGNRRRKRVRDRFVSTTHSAGDALNKAKRDLGHRAQGLRAEALARARHEQVDDDRLVERVRSKLGRLVSHPRSIEVEARDGCVILEGPVLAGEVAGLVAGVRDVRGVREVVNALDVHQAAEGVPALQGGVAPARQTFELAQRNWTPGARLLVGLTGAALAAWGASRRDRNAVVLGTVGLALLARGFGNRPVREVIGRRRAIEVRKTLHVAAPVQEVFHFWSRFENFPRFMTHLVEVRDDGRGGSHWVARGPAGMRVQWEAEITRWRENEVLAWRSRRGSAVPNAGIVRFQPEGDGTRVDITLSYRPPGGALGHFVARLFGADPRSEMDQDLLRFKSLIEVGRTRGRNGSVTREQLDSPAPRDAQVREQVGAGFTEGQAYASMRRQ